MLRRGCQVPRGERGTSSDFRSARSCASHPSSKMEPALALLYHSTFGGTISEHPSGSLGSTALSWIHHSLLMPNPGSATRQRVFSYARSWTGSYLGSSEQTSSIPGCWYVQGLGSSLQPCPAHRSLTASPKISARPAPCPGITSCRAGAATLPCVHLSVQQDVQGRCSPSRITGTPLERAR